MPRPQRELDPDSLVGHFGAELRTYRNKADLSMARLADALGCSAQWIGQVELGDKPPSEEFAYDLDTYFETCGNFHRLWEAIKRAGRCRILLPGFPRYLELEAEAVSVRRFSTQVIPGLLQTEPYNLEALGGASMIELEQTADWRKSSRSAQGGDECVEVAGLPGRIAVRDSTDPGGPVLAFEAAWFRRFVETVRAGEHDV